MITNSNWANCIVVSCEIVARSIAAKSAPMMCGENRVCQYQHEKCKSELKVSSCNCSWNLSCIVMLFEKCAGKQTLNWSVMTSRLKHVKQKHYLTGMHLKNAHEAKFQIKQNECPPWAKMVQGPFHEVPLKHKRTSTLVTVSSSRRTFIASELTSHTRDVRSQTTENIEIRKRNHIHNHRDTHRTNQI